MLRFTLFLGPPFFFFTLSLPLSLSLPPMWLFIIWFTGMVLLALARFFLGISSLTTGHLWLSAVILQLSFLQFPIFLPVWQNTKRMSQLRTGLHRKLLLFLFFDSLPLENYCLLLVYDNGLIKKKKDTVVINCAEQNIQSINCFLSEPSFLILTRRFPLVGLLTIHLSLHFR